MGTLSPTHKPDYSLTEPPVEIAPQPSWSVPGKIVSLDPWGHLVPQVFKAQIDGTAGDAGGAGLDIRPSISVTKAHIKLSEFDEASKPELGRMVIDGKVVIKSAPLMKADGTQSDAWPGVEITVSKAAIDPVWYLPGVAERFGMCVHIFYFPHRPLPPPLYPLHLYSTFTPIHCVPVLNQN